MEIAKNDAKRPANIRASVMLNLLRSLTVTILSFLTFPYICRVLGDSVLGQYTWANTFVSYFIILSRISIPNIAIRECAKVKDDKEKLSHLAQKYFIIQGVMTIISFALMASLVLTIPSFKQESSLIYLLSINFLVGVFSFEWIYIALEKHFYITVRTIMTLAFAALMTFAFIKSKPGYEESMLHLYAAITISSTILTVIINLILLPRHISLKKKAPYDFKGMLKPLFVLFVISFALTLYNQTDSLLLGFLDPSKKEVGSYSVGVKGIDIIITIVTSLYAVFMPRASYCYELEDKSYFRRLINYSFNITFFIAIPAIATMSTMAQPITYLISGSDTSISGGNFASSYLVLIILSSMMLTYSIADNIYTEILIPMKKEKEYAYALLAGVSLNIICSIIFGGFVFNKHPLIAVAAVTAITDVLLLLFLFIRTREYSKKAIFNWNNLKIVGVAIIIAIFTIFVGPFIQKALNAHLDLTTSYLLELIIMVVIDAIIYLGLLLLLKENLVSSFLPKARKERANHGE